MGRKKQIIKRILWRRRGKGGKWLLSADLVVAVDVGTSVNRLSQMLAPLIQLPYEQHNNTTTEPHNQNIISTIRRQPNSHSRPLLQPARWKESEAAMKGQRARTKRSIQHG